jgi:hypothetical protein
MEHTVRQELIAGFVCGFIGQKLLNKLKFDVFIVLSEE